MKRPPLTAIFASLLGAVLIAAAPAAAKLGVLVVSKDRGTVGNQELAQALEGLEREHPIELLLIGPDRQGIENGYRGYTAAAAAALRNRGADEILAIPLFLSEDRALPARFREPVEAAFAPATVTWSEALGESYLAAEILLDRIKAAMTERPVSKLVLALAEGGSEARDERIAALARRLLDAAAPRTEIAEMSVALFDPEQIRVEFAPAQEGHTLLVPLLSDVKFTPHMSLESKLRRAYGCDGVTIADSLLPHPAIRTWIKSRINAHLPPTDSTIGIIVMPHGSSAPYNDGIMAAMPELLGDYPAAFAFGMASPHTIRTAVNELEAAGVRHAVFLRLFSRARSFRAQSDYILGLRAEPPAHGHGAPPERVRTAIRFVTVGGYQPDPLIADILKDRILEVSQEPARESVLLLSHGSFSDRANAASLAVVRGNIERIEQALDTPFRDIRAMSLREDWPDKRAAALRDIRAFLDEANREGRAIVISNRLYGSGSYRKYLEGERYIMNGQGLIPHPNFTRWVDKTLRGAIESLKAGQPLQSAGHNSSAGAGAPH